MQEAQRSASSANPHLQYLKCIREMPGLTQSKVKHKINDKKYRQMMYRMGLLTFKQIREITAEIDKYQTVKSKFLDKVFSFEFKQVGQQYRLSVLSKYHSNTLLKEIGKGELINYQMQTKLMVELAKNLILLHSKGISHNYLRLETIYLKKQELTIGLPFFRSVSRAQIKSKIITHSCLNNELYQLPEYMQGIERTKESDVWDLGLVYLQIMLNHVIDQENTTQIQLSLLVDRVKNSKIKSLLRQMLKTDPKQRITPQKILNYLLNQSQTQLFTAPSNWIILLLAQLYPFHKVKNSNNIKGARTILNKQIKIVELTNKYRKVQALIVKFPKIRGQIIITQDMLDDNVRKHQLSLTLISKFLSQQAMNLVLEDTGRLFGYLSNDILKQTQKNVLSEDVQKMNRIEQLMVAVTGFNNSVYDGFLIGLGIILTCGSALTKNCQLKVIIQNMSNNHYQSSFEESYIRPDNPNKQNYGIVTVKELKFSHLRRQYMTLVSNYNQEQTFEKIRNCSLLIKCHYQAGNHQVFHFPSVKFLSNNRFEIINVKISNDIKEGCPLISVFSSNKCYAIGIFQSPNRGFLFDEHFYWYIWKSITSYEKSNPINMTSRMLEWQNVRLDQTEAPFPVVLKYYGFERQAFYFHPQMQLNYQQFLELKELYIDKKFHQKQGNREKVIQVIDQILPLLSNIYGSESETLAIEQFQKASKITENNLLSLEPQQFMKKIIENEPKYKQNPLLYCKCLLLASTHYLMTKNRQKSRYYIEVCQYYAFKLQSTPILNACHTIKNTINTLIGADIYSQF